MWYIRNTFSPQGRSFLCKVRKLSVCSNLGKSKCQDETQTRKVGSRGNRQRLIFHPPAQNRDNCLNAAYTILVKGIFYFKKQQA